MDIQAEIQYQKEIGKDKGDNIWEIRTKGGLHLVVAIRKGRTDVLGAGPHRAVARFIAKKKAPDLQITELAKSSDVQEQYIQHLLPQYEELTDRLRAMK